jgi:CRISPR-associated protein Cmr3
MPLYTLTPQDVLFFRDGRPIETSGGHGARWPEPSLIFDALHAALHRAFPPNQRQTWEHPHRFGRSSDRDPSREPTQRFGALATAGLFPVLENGDWLFPAPQDVVPSSGDDLRLLLPLSGNEGVQNLPTPLQYSLANPCSPSKENISPWWTRNAFAAYLAGQKPVDTAINNHADLFAGEWTTGIGIDPESQTQDGEHIYSAEYLRLRPEVSLGFSATLPTKQNGSRDDIRDCIDKLFTASRSLIVGGQQRLCSVEPVNHGQTLATVLPQGAPISGKRMKWVLLSPAVFPAIKAEPERGILAHPGGWLPNWIDPETGAVLLRSGDTSRGKGEGREAWRNRVRGLPSIPSKLVAARIPKPTVLTGWTEAVHLRGTLLERDHGPKSTHLAVPAGAVYYFEAASSEDAVNLAAALNWHGNEENPTTIKNRRSTLLGEKGFGLGVCGTWSFYP